MSTEQQSNNNSSHELSVIDFVIIGIYLIVIVIVGLLASVLQKWLERRERGGQEHQQRLEEGLSTQEQDDITQNALQMERKQKFDEFFLGGRSIPWWALACSGMSSNLDVSGTMINVALIYAFGVSGMWIELRGGLTLALCFMMAFLGKWYRRSEVATSSEWMVLRFGNGREGSIARLATVISMIILAIGNIIYFSVGSGKFIAQFLSIPNWLGIRQEFWASLLMIIIAMLYTVTSGLSGVVWTDVFQGFFIFIAIFIVCVKGFIDIKIPSTFTLSAPLRDGTYFMYNTTWTAWKNPIPDWQYHFPPQSTYSSYNMFGVAIMLYCTKLMIEGFGGQTSYGEQRYFAAKSEKEAGILTGLWIILLSFRWPFIITIVLYGIYFGNGYGGSVIEDPEVVLPRVIATMMPSGLKGIIVGAMMSAAMSTFDSIVNAASATFTKDIYLAFIHKDASPRVLLFVGRLSGILMVTIGMLASLLIKNINEIWGWVTMALGAGLQVPLLMRFYWWRVNGYGYAGGLLIGTLSAISLKLILTLVNYELPEYYIFVIISGISFVAIVTVSLLTPRTDDEILLRFYAKVRPFGFWHPYKSRVANPLQKHLKKESICDIATLGVALPWQLLNYLFFISLALQSWLLFGIITPILIIAYIILYFLWLRRLLNPEIVTIEDEDIIHKNDDTKHKEDDTKHKGGDKATEMEEYDITEDYKQELISISNDN
jgi:SSS family solute:Na+ symporter